MKLAAWAIALALPSLALAADEPPLPWAFLTRGASPPAADPAAQLSLPGSDRHYTEAQIDDIRNPPDWLPDSHPPAPDIVMHAKGGALACGACHLMSGMGHPESSGVAGLDAAYTRRQLDDFKSGARKNPIQVDGKPEANTVQAMVGIAQALTPEDAAAAAAYFAALKPFPWVKVVESDTAPKSYVNAGYMRVMSDGGGTEALGDRIIELPQDQTRQLLRDPRSGTVAYVPKGSLAHGAALAKTVGCAGCHGAGLVGVGDTPHIAGRSPLYIFRQLYAFRAGARTGPHADLMRPAVANLSDADMIALSAYVASLNP